MPAETDIWINIIGGHGQKLEVTAASCIVESNLVECGT